MSASTSPLPAGAPARRRLREVGQLLHSEGAFTGGPPQYFEIAGRLQLGSTGLRFRGIVSSRRVKAAGSGEIIGAAIS